MLEELLRQLEEMRAERATAVTGMEATTEVARSESRALTAEEDTEFQTAMDLVTDLDTRSEAVQVRVTQLEAIEANNVTAQRAAPFNIVTNTNTDPYDVPADASVAEVRSRVETVLDNERSVSSTQGDHALAIVARADRGGNQVARHILASGRDEYRSAWGKLMRDGDALSLTADESRAVAEVRAISLTDADGGYAVPFVLDPTIMITDAGVVDPIRSLARVETVAGDNWHGINATGVTASWVAESGLTPQVQPVLTQPEVKPEKAAAFARYSIEIGEDWGGMESTLREMFGLAKMDLEADAFLNGNGSGKPFGVLTGLGAGQEVASAGAGAFATADVYAMENALPARHRSRAQFLADRPVYNMVRQMSNTDGHALWERIGAGLPAQLIGYPVNEASEMESAVAGGNEILVLGDFKNYLIVDRIGMSVENIPHLFNSSNGQPTGERGLYMHWRVGGKVLNPDGFRVLAIA